jgi:alpha-N-arabinofuranosidase
MARITFFLLAAACALAQTLVEVDASKPAHSIPRTIYGTFLEPIGNAIYGGLWAQVLENPSFEEGLWTAQQVRARVTREPELAEASRFGMPLPWQPLDAAQGQRYEPRWGDAANSGRSLFVMALPGKETGVRQQVYLPVHRVLEYNGSIWTRHVSGPASLAVSIRKRNRPEAVLARAALETSGREWTRHEFRLVLESGALARLEPADFVVSTSDEARILIDQVLLFPADAVDGMEPEMVEMSRALRTPLVRFGGNFTSGYHWRDGVGPAEKRVSMLNQAWGIPEYNHFGTDEFLRFCRLVGAEPQIAVNLGSGTPEEAAGWVRYVNGKWGSGGLLWELGNELWGTFQIGYPTLQRAAARTLAFSKAVRAADPGARLIATGDDPDRFRDWNRELLEKAPGAYEYLATHFVVGGAVKKQNASRDFVALASFALPVGLERALREMKAQIGGAPVKIAFTEWLFHGRDETVPHFGNQGGAVCAAGFLNTLLRVADFTPIADMTGLIEFGGVWKKKSQVYGVPAYWAFRMYSEAAADRFVPVRTAGETYDVHEGNTRIPEIAAVPYLDVAAALDASGKRLTLFCVNRDLHRDTPARIRIAGFAPSGNARVRTLAASSITAVNDEIRPREVRPVERVIKAAAEFEEIFPRASVTVLELER